MDAVTALEEHLPAPTEALAQGLSDLANRHKHGLSRLLTHRADLRGVYAFADVVEESVRWSA